MRIVEMRNQGASQQKIAAEYGICRSRVGQILAVAEMRARRMARNADPLRAIAVAKIASNTAQD